MRSYKDAAFHPVYFFKGEDNKIKAESLSNIHYVLRALGSFLTLGRLVYSVDKYCAFKTAKAIKSGAECEALEGGTEKQYINDVLTHFKVGTAAFGMFSHLVENKEGVSSQLPTQTSEKGEPLSQDVRESNNHSPDTVMHDFDAPEKAAENQKASLIAEARRNFPESSTTKLWNAIKEGRDQAVQECIKQGADINHVDNEGKTALMYALSLDRYSIARKLIHSMGRESLDVRDGKGDTALMMLVNCRVFSKTRKEVVQLLVAKGASRSLQNKKGEMALSLYLAGHDDKDIIQLLTPEDVSSLSTKLVTKLLFQAIVDGDQEKAKTFIRHADLSAKNEMGMTPLLSAISLGRLGIIKEILSARVDVDVDVQDKDGRTWLMNLLSANDDRYDSIINDLIKHSRDLNRKDNQGTTALMIAAEKSDVTVVRSLVNSGAKIEEQDEQGRTAYDRLLAMPTPGESFEKVRYNGKIRILKPKEPEMS